jgi:hypothetical protein
MEYPPCCQASPPQQPGGRGPFRARSPSGALPRLSPKALRPKAQSGPALHGRGQAIRSPGSQLLADRRCAGRAGFRTARGQDYEPHPGHRPRSINRPSPVDVPPSERDLSHVADMRTIVNRNVTAFVALLERLSS